MKQYDMIVVGGGPAGSTLALRAAHSQSVLVLEKRHLLDENRIHEIEKCCGGMLDHEAQKELAHLGLALPKKVLCGPGVFTVRAIDFDNYKERYYQRNYLNIDRQEFDSFLLRQAAARPNVTVMDGTSVFAIMNNGTGCAVKVRHEDGTQETICGTYLIGADGPSSKVRASAMHKYAPDSRLYHAPRMYAAIQEWHRTARPLPYYAAVFDQRVTDYYSWIIPKGKFILVGSAIPVGYDRVTRKGSELTVKERFECLRKDLTKKGFDVSYPVKREGEAILRPHMFGSIYTGGGHIYLCGEAAGLISPSSSEGISFAMRSGEALARAMRLASLGDPRPVYEQLLTGMRVQIAAKTLKSPVMYGPILRNAVFITRLTSMSVLKDTERWT